MRFPSSAAVPDTSRSTSRIAAGTLRARRPSAGRRRSSAPDPLGGGSTRARRSGATLLGRGSRRSLHSERTPAAPPACKVRRRGVAARSRRRLPESAGARARQESIDLQLRGDAFVESAKDLQHVGITVTYGHGGMVGGDGERLDVGGGNGDEGSGHERPLPTVGATAMKDRVQQPACRDAVLQRIDQRNVAAVGSDGTDDGLSGSGRASWTSVSGSTKRSGSPASYSTRAIRR